MNKFTLLIISLFFSFNIHAQSIGKDFFGNLTYESARDDYKAKLEKNIFNDLIFTDNQKNKVTFNNKFLTRANPTVLSNSRAQEEFFIQQAKYYRNTTNRQEEFSIDIFDNWNFKSNLNNYQAEFKKDIFNARIFSDNKNNEVSYDEKYIANLKENPFRNSEAQFYLFMDLIDLLSQEKGYKATFKVDIFNKVIVSDNRGYKRESNDAYYILPEFNLSNSSMPTSDLPIRKVSHQEFIYQEGKDFANLIQNRFKKWTYEDSLGNNFQLSNETWTKLIRIYKHEEAILAHFVMTYLN